MTKHPLIAMQLLHAVGRVIPVHFSRNAGGSVAGRFLLGAENTPILDGPTPEAVMQIMREVLESLVLARKAAA